MTNSSNLTTALAKHPFFNNVRYTHIRKILDEDKKELYDILDIHPEIKYRAKIVLLAGEGSYTVPEIREMTNTYDKTIRKWIHRFNDNGSTNGLFTEINYSPPMIKITDRAKKEIINAYHHQLIQ